MWRQFWFLGQWRHRSWWYDSLLSQGAECGLGQADSSFTRRHRSRAWRQSAGVLMLKSSRCCDRDIRSVRASQAWASLCNENCCREICWLTSGKSSRRSRNGNPFTRFCSAKTGLSSPRPRLTRLSSSPVETNGMSHERNNTASAGLVESAVKTPPNGPHRGTRSRRMTRVGNPSFRVDLSTRCSSVAPPNFNRLLSRPIRELLPPARMQTSQEKLSQAGFVIDSRITRPP